MKKQKILFFAPRILAVIFILFISLFALDVFEMEGSTLEKIGGFLIHLIPSYIIAAVLLIAWKKDELGAILFGLLFIFSVLFLGNWRVDLLLFSPLLLVAVLFLINMLMKNEGKVKL